MNHARLLRQLMILTLVSLVSASNACGAAPVEGDEAALSQFLDAFRANADKFPHGRIEFRCESKFKLKAGGFEIATGEGAVDWSGDRERWNVTSTVTRRGAEDLPEPVISKTLVIRNRGDSFSYLEPSERQPGIAKIVAGQPIVAHPMFEFVSPRKWGNYERENISWSKRLDPAEAGPLTEKFVVSREGDEIRIVQQFETFPAAEVVGSFAQGGNVVSYDWPGTPNPRPNSVSYSRRGEYEWSETADGRWLPKMIRLLRFVPEKPDDVVLEFNCEILKFAPDEPAEAQFGFDLVVLASETKVSASSLTGGQATRKTATEDAASNREVLEDLAREVGAERFVSPGS